MILSFYSYKGGVGRTQLLANTAAYFCFYKNLKVLMLEWDLEAPGIHYFFGKDSAKIEQEGLIETLTAYMNLMQTGKKYTEEDLPFFKEENIIKNLITSKNGNGRVDLIPAARYTDPFYTQKISDFDWQEFMELRDGKVYIDFLKKKLRAFHYDFILIDSRTGIADYSGLCNILMPDANVVIVAPTRQNFEGALRIANAIQQHPYVTEGYRQPFIMPILSRIDNETYEYEDWVERFQEDFSKFTTPFLSERFKTFNEEIFRDVYLPETILEYNRKLALGENLVFDKTAKTKTRVAIEKNYENIANNLFDLAQKGHIDFAAKITNNMIETWEADEVEIADAYEEVGNLEKALHYLEQGLNKQQQTVAKEPQNADEQQRLGVFYERLGSINLNLGNLDKALEFFEETNKLFKELYTTYPNNVNFKNNLAISYQHLGITYSLIGNLDKALAFHEDFNLLSKELYTAYPNNVGFKNSLAISYSKLGETHSLLGNLDKALAFYEEYNRLAKELYTAYPNNVGFKNGLAISYMKLYFVYLEKKNTAYAKQNLEKAVKLFEELAKDFSAYPDFRNKFELSKQMLKDLE